MILSRGRGGGSEEYIIFISVSSLGLRFAGRSRAVVGEEKRPTKDVDPIFAFLSYIIKCVRCCKDNNNVDAVERTRGGGCDGGGGGRLAPDRYSDRAPRRKRSVYKSGRPFYPSVSPPTAPLLRAFGIE